MGSRRIVLYHQHRPGPVDLGGVMLRVGKDTKFVAVIYHLQKGITLLSGLVLATINML
jgi:hypothetical protein